MSQRIITVQAVVGAPIEKVWEAWTTPEHITQWNFASSDWHCPRAESDVRTGGTFRYRMEAVDGSEGFDFTGTYTQVKEYKLLEYDMNDDASLPNSSDQANRHVAVKFSETSDGVLIVESFEPEQEHSEELQRAGWQAILDNFKKHVEFTK